jgi:hypothetical protein
MGCYLCVYQMTQVPKTVAPFPARGTLGQPVGTCWFCHVSACPAHASRPSQFMCAICLPGIAAQQAVGGPGAAADGRDGAAAAVARLVGERADEGQLRRGRIALERVVADRRAMYEAGQDFDFEFGAAEWREPNVVSGIGETIRRREGADVTFIPEVQRHTRAETSGQPAVGVMPVAVIAATVRDAFAHVEPRDPTEDAVLVATGALLLATVVADEPDAIELGREPQVLPTNVEVRAPSEMTHPVLLHPAIWALATAWVVTG